MGLCLEMLRLNNFSVLTCLDISRTLSDKSAFLFVRSAVPVQAAPDTPNYASSFGFDFKPLGVHAPIFSDLPASNQKSLNTLIVSLTDVDHLRFIGKFDDKELKEFMEPLRYFPFGIEKEFWENDIIALRQNYDRCYKVEFKTRPWAFIKNGYSMNNAGWHAISMIGNLFYKLESQGWKVVCSGDVSGKCVRGGKNSPSYSIDCHSWFLVKMQ